jgi:hypothetical protein
MYWYPDEKRFNSKEFFSNFPIFRGVSMIILMLWCWGVMVFIYKRYRINYVFIMQFDPRTALGHFQVFKVAAQLTCLWMITFLFFIGHSKTDFSVLGINPKIYPLILIFGFIFLIINPFHLYYR